MIQNKDYKMVYRHGHFVDKATMRREHESASIVALAIGAAVVMIVVAMVFQSCGLAGGVPPATCHWI